MYDVVIKKSSRSLSHLLVSFLLFSVFLIFSFLVLCDRLRRPSRQLFRALKYTYRIVSYNWCTQTSTLVFGWRKSSVRRCSEERTFDVKNNDLALDRVGVDRTAIFALVERFDIEHLQVPLVDVLSYDGEPQVVHDPSILVRQRNRMVVQPRYLLITIVASGEIRVMFSRPTRTYQTYRTTPPTFLIWNNLCDLVYQRPTRRCRSQTAVA